ncbi:hypothetical protein MPSEU_000491100 [Mayamaea pseudoterrestris]|nr:hypothetical protein MPSEU_000491100 [Mayamaea pseudoterrestris]
MVSPRLTLVVLSTITLCLGDELNQSSRRLAYRLAGFDPTFLITDEAAIDQDQRLMINLMAKGTKEGFLDAWRVYQDGAFSRPYAVLTLEKPLPHKVKIGTPISGRSMEGVRLNCEALETTEAGEKTLKVRYLGSESLDPQSRCAVGANPIPITTGCMATNGAIEILGEVEFSTGYVYNKLTDNKNDRAIERMSKNAFKKMRPRCFGGGCGYFKDFRKFEQYYGTADYGDKFTSSAFKGGFANFTHGDANFRDYDFDARAAAIMTATSFMILTQYILQELEHSLDKCEHAECKEEHCLKNAIQSMEAGVAYYTGSLEGPDGSGNGYLLYALADKMCKVFKTCGPNGDKTSDRMGSKINIEMFDQFKQMQANIKSHRCTPARKNKERIAILMSVPLIQATLMQAYIGDRQPGASLVDEAHGAAFAASVVPIVASCKVSDGNIIYANMKTGKGYKGNFEDVKLAFERNYECMGVKCSDVGGYWFNGIASGFYMDGFYPCGVEPPKPWTGGQVVGFVFASLVGTVVLYGVFKTCRYFHFFGFCKTMQKRARRPVILRPSLGVDA